MDEEWSEPLSGKSFKELTLLETKADSKNIPQIRNKYRNEFHKIYGRLVQ